MEGEKAFDIMQNNVSAFIYNSDGNELTELAMFKVFDYASKLLTSEKERLYGNKNQESLINSLYWKMKTIHGNIETYKESIRYFQ